MTDVVEVAAVDLGSNSFKLQIARLQGEQLVFHDALREMVQLRAGLGSDGLLEDSARLRAVSCLRRFGERLRGLSADRVRVVATNTFRVAGNIREFLTEAEQALGFVIEIISGYEEARLIYAGVTHELPKVAGKRLVVDIGGGSTELIIGQGLKPESLESLYMGCVGHSMRFFSDGKLNERNFRKADIATRSEMQGVSAVFSAENRSWQQAVGSSGTIRALSEILRLQGLSDGCITPTGLEAVRELLLKAQDIKKLRLEGLSPERASSFPGGIAILGAIFAELAIPEMQVANWGLREGVLYELVGRMQHDDIRELTVTHFVRRYHVEVRQVERVSRVALMLFDQMHESFNTLTPALARQYLLWAVSLHEIGVSISHAGYHKHSAYIVENADMPGFSRLEQDRLGLLLRCQRRSLLGKQLDLDSDLCRIVLLLRLAVLLCGSRSDLVLLPPVHLSIENHHHFVLTVESGWLVQNPLSGAQLDMESEYWKELGITLERKA